MFPTTTKKRVEAPITDAEYDAALQYATMKLTFQSELYHKDFDDQYLTVVVAEQVNQQRLDAYYEDLVECLRMAREEFNKPDNLGKRGGLQDGNLGDREERDAFDATSSLDPYYSTVPETTQYMEV